MLAPDRESVLALLDQYHTQAFVQIQAIVKTAQQKLVHRQETMVQTIERLFADAVRDLQLKTRILETINPARILQRGYAVVRKGGTTVRSQRTLESGDHVDIEFFDGKMGAKVQ